MSCSILNKINLGRTIMRKKYALMNLTINISSKIIIILLGFISRKIFITYVGFEILGLNGLFTSIISILSLTELGVGTAIACSLYKPLADKNYKQVKEIMILFRNVYRKIAVILFTIGLIMIPFLKYLWGESEVNVSYSYKIYLLFLFEASISYLFSYKKILLSADQKNFIVQISNLIYQIVVISLQIIILVTTKKYLLYLFIKIIFNILESFIISKYVDYKYQFLNKISKTELDDCIKNDIITNVKALILHRMGNFLVTGTDNLIISSFLGVIIVGKYSNYNMIFINLKGILTQFSNGLIATFGNLISTEKSEKVYNHFRIILMINFFVFNFSTVGLIILMQKFITLWIGSEGLISSKVVLILCIDFYISGLSEVLGTVRASAGLFNPDKYLHILLAFVNLVISIVLLSVMGMGGVFIGTLVCLIIKEVCVLPRIVYSNIFKQPVLEYYLMLAKYVVITIVSFFCSYFLCNRYSFDSIIIQFLYEFFVCITVPNLIAILLVFRTTEFDKINSILKSLIHRKFVRVEKEC